MTEREQIWKHKEQEGRRKGFSGMQLNKPRRQIKVFVNSAANLGRTITRYLSSPGRHNWLTWLLIRHVLLTASFKAVKVVLVLLVMLCHNVEAGAPKHRRRYGKKKSFM